jgi:AcrR family transcriptional regulator
MINRKRDVARTVDPAKHRARRQQILDAAAGVFAARGFDGTSIADICNAAGTSPGNLYHYFPSKRDIFAAVLTGGGAETAEQLAAAMAGDDPWEALLDFVHHLTVSATAPGVPNLVLEALLQAYRDPELAQLLDRDAQDEEAGVLALLTRAADADLIDPHLDLHQTAGWIMALVGAVYTRAATEEGFDPVAQLPMLRLTLARLLRATPDP